MENFTSPAARMPYPGTNAMTQQSGFTIVIKIIICMQSFALSASITADHRNRFCQHKYQQTACNDNHF